MRHAGRSPNRARLSPLRLSIRQLLSDVRTDRDGVVIRAGEAAALTVGVMAILSAAHRAYTIKQK
jgi:hypothetical protein